MAVIGTISSQISFKLLKALFPFRIEGSKCNATAKGDTLNEMQCETPMPASREVTCPGQSEGWRGERKQKAELAERTERRGGLKREKHRDTHVYIHVYRHRHTQEEEE